ncbi:MAG: MFS transporter [Anaerolineales bacterium]|nr:MFS transporter [Anaerolineales bacterium]
MLEPLALHKIQRRITGAIFASESLFSAGYIASITLLSLNATQLSGSEALAGVPSTMALLVRAVAAIPIGWMMDKFGRRPIVTLGYLFGVIGLATGGFAVGLGSFALLCLSAGITGIASGASQQTRFIASEVWPAARRSSIIGFIVFAGTIGAIGGPLLVAPTSALAAQLGLAANAGPYYVGAFITLLSMMLAFSLLRPDPKQISAAMETARKPAAKRRHRCARSARSSGLPPFNSP